MKIPVSTPKVRSALLIALGLGLSFSAQAECVQNLATGELFCSPTLPPPTEPAPTSLPTTEPTPTDCVANPAACPTPTEPAAPTPPPTEPTPTDCVADPTACPAPTEPAAPTPPPTEPTPTDCVANPTACPTPTEPTPTITTCGTLLGIACPTAGAWFPDYTTVLDPDLIPTEFFDEATGEDFYQFQPTLFSQLLPEQIDRLPPDAFLGLDGEQLAAFKPEVFAVLDEQQVGNLPPAAWKNLPFESFARLPRGSYGGFDGDDFGELPETYFDQFTADDLAAFDYDALTGLTEAQFSRLSLDDLKGLTAANLGGLPPQVINNMTLAQFQALDPLALQGLAEQSPQDFLKLLVNLSTEATPETEMIRLVLPSGLLHSSYTMDDSGEIIPHANSELALRYPILEFAPDFFAQNISYEPPFDLNKGLGLGGAGRSALELLQESLADFPEFSITQNAEGFLELVGSGESAGIRLPLQLTQDSIVQAPEGTTPGLGIDPDTGAFTLTARNGRQFKLSFGPPGLSCVAKAVGIGQDTTTDGSLSMNQFGISVIQAPTPQTTATNRRYNWTTTPAPIIYGWPGGWRRSSTPGFYNLGIRRTDSRPVGELVYDGSSGTADCTGAQTIYPTVPDPDALIVLLIQLGLSANDIHFRVDGSFRFSFDGAIYDIVPDFPSSYQTVARGKTETTRFEFSDNGKIFFLTPYNGGLLKIPLQLILQTN